jgi:Tfp pilus assembly protein PilF
MCTGKEMRGLTDRRTRLFAQSAALLTAITISFVSAIDSRASDGEAKRFIELGKMLEFNANLEMAEKAYQQALSIDPNSVEAHKGLARVNSHLGKTERATQELKSVTSLTAEDEMDCIQTARLMRKQGRAKDAVALLKTACDKQHDDRVLERELAFSFLEAGEATRATDQFHDLIKQEPEVIDNYIGLAIADFRKGDVAESENDIHKILEMNPEEPNTLCLQADLALSRSNVKDAIEIYEKAIKIKPNLTKPYLSLGTLYLKNGETEKAGEILETARRLCPPEADVYIGLALVEERNHSPKRALELYERAAELETDAHRKEDIRRHLDEIRDTENNPGMGINP